MNKKKKKCYPLIVDNQRQLPEGYGGPLYIWDVDKTYLSTHFSSLKGIARIPLEYAVDKVAIPGMPAILRGLRRGPGPEFMCAPLYFVSASPVQMSNVLKQKMLIDGVDYDGIVLKDWAETVVKLRFGRLKEQLGYKLCALLTLKQGHPLAEEYLFGDDYEKDAVAFSLYARLLAGEISRKEAVDVMIREGTKEEDRRCVFSLLETLPAEKGGVKRIFINLEKNTPPQEFNCFGDRVVPVKGAVQLGLALYELNKIDREALNQTFNSATFGEELSELVSDALSRGLISEANKGILPG